MRPLGFVGGALVVAAGAVATFGASCGGAPTPVPVRTFLQPQKVDFVCLNVNDANGNPIPPTPAPQTQCPPVPPNVSGTPFAFHEYAVVTQTLRGELAVVDLTMGVIVDEDRSLPGVNFIPVGAVPTDVAVTPDGTHTYVTSADPSLPAIYGIDNHLILGDSEALAQRLPPLNNFSQIAACRLPQLPDAVAVIPMPVGGDAGASSDGGAGAAGGPAYALVVLLRSQESGAPAQVAVVVPPTQLGGLGACTILGMTGAFSSSLVGASSAPGPTWSDGVVFADAGDLGDTEPPPGPETLCHLPSPPAGSSGITPTPGAVLDAGEAMGSADASDASPLDAPGPSDAQVISDASGPSDAQPDAQALATDAESADGGPGDATPAGPGAVDGGSTEAMASGASDDAGAAQSMSGLPIGPLSSPRPTSMVLRDGPSPIAYVADATIPVIHVIDLTDPTHPREVSELLATSQAQPTRRVSVGGLALSPTTRDYKRYLYAIDSSDGSLMVFDVTDSIPAPFTPPLQRPHAELNPFVPRDRISFAAPVAAVSFAYNEWPLPLQVDAAAPSPSGLLCNPNPNARLDSGAPGSGAAAGSFYCADQAVIISPQGSLVQGFPQRLRGWFGFAVLTNGNVAVIDLDDWDAPCRRPDPMTPTTRTGVLDFPEPNPTGTTDLDPYHVPVAWPAMLDPSATLSAVTQEPFYPVSAPNRPRSNFLLRDDPTSGNHIPNMLSPPVLSNSNGAPLSADPTEPVMLPTVLPSGFVDPTLYTTPIDPHDNYTGTPIVSADAAASTSDAGDTGTVLPSAEPGSVDTVPGIRVSFDDPTAQIDQGWWVTYEGALPTTSPLVANIFSTSQYQDLTFSLGAATGSVPEAGSVFAAGGGFCEVGVEDWSLGQARAQQVQMAMLNARLPGESGSFPQGAALPQWTSDYLEITDNILPSNDCYWQENLSGEGGLSGGCITGQGSDASASPAESNSCDWGGFDFPADQSVTSGKDVARNRYNLCQQTFGPPDNPTNGPYSLADNYLLRDFPIVEAFDDHLVVTRFQWNPGESSCPERTTNRTVFAGTNGDGRDPSNTQYFKLAQCCFHNQAGFKIRTGGEWAVVGQNGLGFVHHVQTDPTSGRCVLSCDPLDVLRNGRTFDIPYGIAGAPNQCAPPTVQIDRANPLAFRNPMFSFAMWQGCNPEASSDAGSGFGLCVGFGDHTTSQRDLSWRFSMQGGFTPLTFSLEGVTDTPVVPQSVRPLPTFQQLAIVDGAQQGLILIDLHTLQFAHDPYF
jgi:hypothetical protein